MTRGQHAQTLIINIYLIFRRRSKSHASSLHSYCVSGRGGVAGGEGQFYDDLYLSGHLGSAPHRTLNQYSRHNTFYRPHQVSRRGGICYLGDNLLSSPTHNNSIYHKPFIGNPLRILLVEPLKLKTRYNILSFSTICRENRF